MPVRFSIIQQRSPSGSWVIFRRMMDFSLGSLPDRAALAPTRSAPVTTPEAIPIASTQPNTSLAMLTTSTPETERPEYASHGVDSPVASPTQSIAARLERARPLITDH